MITNSFTPGLPIDFVVLFVLPKKQGGSVMMILQALKSNIKDDSKPSQVGDESSFAIMEMSDEGND